MQVHSKVSSSPNKSVVASTDFELSSIHLRKLALVFAEENGIEHRFNCETKTVGIYWFESFKVAHNFTFRNPETTYIAWRRGFNKVAVQKFFTILKDVDRNILRLILGHIGSIMQTSPVYLLCR